MKRFLNFSLTSPATRYAEVVSVFTNAEKEQLYSDEMQEAIGGLDAYDLLIGAFSDSRAIDPADAAMDVDVQTYLPGELLVKTDIATMANSLEARSPLLDHKVMEFAASLPADMKIRGRTSKWLLKQAAWGWVPDGVIDRPKMSMRVPVAAWLRNELRDLVHDASPTSPPAAGRTSSRPRSTASSTSTSPVPTTAARSGRCSPSRYGTGPSWTTGRSRPYGSREVKILRVITRLNIGGPARQALMLHRELQERGHDCEMVSGAPQAEEGAFPPPAERYTLLPSLRRETDFVADAKAIRALTGLMRATSPDIVHTETTTAGGLGRIAARRAKVPVVVHTYHGHVLSGYLSGLQSKALTAAERALAKRTDALVSVSTRVRDELLALGIGKPEQWRVVPLGLELGELLHGPAEASASRGRPRPAGGRSACGHRRAPAAIKNHQLFLAMAATAAAARPTSPSSPATASCGVLEARARSYRRPGPVPRVGHGPPRAVRGPRCRRPHLPQRGDPRRPHRGRRRRPPCGRHRRGRHRGSRP